jgi:hypothetical protein
MLDRRETAEKQGGKCVAPPIPDRDTFDLVKVDADPVVSSSRW